MNFFCIAAMALFVYSCTLKIHTHKAEPAISQTLIDKSGNPMLLGIHSKQDLEQFPYKEWFDKNYSTYSIDSFTVNQLKHQLKGKHFEIFMGTWCGDSRREVPRMFKLLEFAGVKSSAIKLIMVDNHDSTYKQSPGHEEKGKHIFRVPDFIVYDGDKEINRIIESPVVSLEKDLLDITTGNQYQPNYKGGLFLAKAMQQTMRAPLTIDSVVLIGQLTAITASSIELNSLGYVWLAAGETEKAVWAFQLNALLFPADVNVYDSLGEISLKMGDKEKAKQYYRKVLEIQPANTNALKMLSQLK